MAKPSEHKSVQARILAYAREIGWSYVPRGEAEKRRGFDRSKATSKEQAAEASPYFDDLLDSQVRTLNPKYAEGPGALVGDLRRLHADIAGNRDFLAYLPKLALSQCKGPTATWVTMTAIRGLECGLGFAGPSPMWRIASIRGMVYNRTPISKITPAPFGGRLFVAQERERAIVFKSLRQ